MDVKLKVIKQNPSPYLNVQRYNWRNKSSNVFKSLSSLHHYTKSLAICPEEKKRKKFRHLNTVNTTLALDTALFPNIIDEKKYVLFMNFDGFFRFIACKNLVGFIYKCFSGRPGARLPAYLGIRI